jgi:predicted double-glycine peptidase
MMEYAEANGYCGNRQGTYWSFFTEGAVKLGFIVKEEYKTEQKLKNLLNEGKLIILSVGPGHFTSAGHFIVVTGYEDGYFTVNDPNSYENSARKWKYEEFQDQIKNIWSFCK